MKCCKCWRKASISKIWSSGNTYYYCIYCFKKELNNINGNDNSVNINQNNNIKINEYENVKK